MKPAKIFTVAAVCLLVVCVLASTAPIAAHGSDKPTNLIIATATTEGTYYPIGVGMASLWSIKLAKNHGIQVQPITSAGCCGYGPFCGTRTGGENP
jgi:uncharacterized protein